MGHKGHMPDASNAAPMPAMYMLKHEDLVYYNPMLLDVLLIYV